MSTVNFSVPEDVKQSFNKTFRGQNKSAIIAGLMREVVTETTRASPQGVSIPILRRLRGVIASALQYYRDPLVLARDDQVVQVRRNRTPVRRHPGQTIRQYR